jgi:signal transduction histidine kinase
LSHQLHPAKLRLLGLVQTLDGLCRELSQQAGVDVRFLGNGIPPEVPEPTALCIFRVAQEALQNALKHSGASRIEVSLAAEASGLTLCVADNGRGFDPLAAEGRGIGFLTMRERVELSGGTFHIDGGSGGTTICATLPFVTGHRDGASRSHEIL